MWRRWWARRRPEDTASDAAAAPAPAPPERKQEELAPEEAELLDRIARATARWGMTVPAVFMLESSKPLSFVAGQFLHFLSPIAHSIAPTSS